MIVETGDKEAHPQSHPVPLPPTFLVSRVMVPKRALGRPQGWGTGRWLQVGLRRTGPRHGGTGSDSELGRQEGVPGKGQEATLSHPLKIKPEPQPGTLRPRPGLPLPGFPLFLSREPHALGRSRAPPGWGRPRDRAGTRTWAFGTPAPRPSHLRTPPSHPGRVAEVPAGGPT